MRELPRRRRSSTTMEPFYPLHVRVCRACLLVQLGQYVTPEDIFTRVRLLLVVLRQLARARRGLRRGDHRPTRPRARQLVGRRARQQRRLSPAVLRRARHPGARHRARRERRRGGAGERGVETLVEFFGVELARRAGRRRAARPTSSSATTSWRRCPTSTTSSPASRTLLKPGGVGHAGVPAPPAADRGQPVRHHLPRALLVLLACTVERIFAGPRPRRLRRRGAADPRRLAAHLRWPGATARPGRRPRP